MGVREGERGGSGNMLMNCNVLCIKIKIIKLKLSTHRLNRPCKPVALAVISFSPCGFVCQSIVNIQLDHFTNLKNFKEIGLQLTPLGAKRFDWLEFLLSKSITAFILFKHQACTIVFHLTSG